MLNILFHKRCPVCNGSNPTEDVICQQCIEKIQPLNRQCIQCGTPLSSGLFKGCGECIHEKLPFEFLISLYDYKEVSLLIHSFKYGASIRAIKALNHLIHRAMERLDFIKKLAEDYQYIVPVPIHWRRRLLREFNHAEILAEELSEHLKIPVVRAIKRERYTPPQVSLKKRERLLNPKGSFAVVKAPTTAIVVDDVATTLATLKEIACSLKGAGTRKVGCIVFARAYL